MKRMDASITFESEGIPVTTMTAALALALESEAIKELGALDIVLINVEEVEA